MSALLEEGDCTESGVLNQNNSFVSFFFEEEEGDCPIVISER
jgi:hypothetical protein